MRLGLARTLALAVIAYAMLPAAAGADDEEDALLPHPRGRWWLSGQVNLIDQYHGDFAAAYSGPNSLRPQAENALSSVATLYSGYRVARTVELLVDVEAAGGTGLSQTLGLAGFSNLDVVRNPSLSKAPYLARGMVHVVVPLGREWSRNERGPLSTFEELPDRRLELRLGKFGTADFLDLNSVGSDSHRQFMNWAVDNDAAYDYMADTRGYTVGLFAEDTAGWWSLRGAVGLMPRVANGPSLDTDLAHARGQNLELEWRRPFLQGRATHLRLLVYRNLARMGVYRDALQLAEVNGTTPDVAADGQPGRAKNGFGLNVDQELGGGVRVFARAGWNDGRTESFAYTEVDRTVALGGDLQIPGRRQDRAGLALVTSALSADHRDYLAAGGLGFILGDGALRYGHEQILEGYYTVGLWRGLSAALDLQWIHNPGYNQDRGPVLIASARLHLEL